MYDRQKQSNLYRTHGYSESEKCAFYFVLFNEETYGNSGGAVEMHSIQAANKQLVKEVCWLDETKVALFRLNPQ